MTDSFAETKRELYELMERMRHSRTAPPTPEGVTPSEGRAMMAITMLESCGEAIRPRRVAEMAHTTPSALSQTLKTLEDKGFIERRRTSDDYRAITVSLTDEGEKFAAESKRLRDEHMNLIMAAVGEEDMRHLTRIFRKVVDLHDHAETDDAVRQASRPSDKEGDAPCA